MPTLSEAAQVELDKILEEGASILPGCFFRVGTADSVLYSKEVGRFDVLKAPSPSNIVDKETILWFASTTKFLTSLVDKGLFTLQTPVHELGLKELTPPLKLLQEFDDAGEPVFVETSQPVTVAMLCNQSSGVETEFADIIQQWKRWTKVGGGYINSCQEVNLVNTPLTAVPGTTWKYGNAAEWLGVLIARLTGQSLEDYFQQHIFAPLGITSTTFIPFAKEALVDKLMPLRFWNASRQEWEVLEGQLPMLTLPRRVEDIQYHVGGGGIYATPDEYLRVCQHILQNLHSYSESCLLSKDSLDSLFQGTLPASAKKDIIAGMMGHLFDGPKEGDLDWSTGLCMYSGEGPRGGWGRHPGSGGWMGAAGTEFWIDPKAGIACVWSTNMLPQLDPRVLQVVKKLERAVYAGLQQ